MVKLNVICSKCLINLVQLEDTNMWQCPRCQVEVIIEVL